MLLLGNKGRIYVRSTAMRPKNAHYMYDTNTAHVVTGNFTIYNLLGLYFRSLACRIFQE